ncbi:RND multidrug efflux transporter [Enhygromyxa salina]|uniref:RND multidrug efflux transporter n=1 Tax=Enhygromyxa salina TaxID=215803 RepID=A0A0C2D006_9BACT|nr:efflux RND transporter permease subunit [Enhygromyxa salina]KIG15190.1 RND multidrug efflux transporter [Enhygromyxa salina]
MAVAVAAPGVSATDVEHLIVSPIEAAIIGVPGVSHVTSEAREGHARVELQFTRGTAEAGRMAVVEALAELRSSLPPDIDGPVVLPPAGPSSIELRWSLSSDDIDLATLTKLHDRLVKHSFGVPGVSSVQACALRRRIVIELDPRSMLALDISGSEVEAGLHRSLLGRPELRQATADIESLRSTMVAAATSLAIMAYRKLGGERPRCRPRTAATSTRANTSKHCSAGAERPAVHERVR